METFLEVFPDGSLKIMGTEAPIPSVVAGPSIHSEGFLPIDWNR
jgi:hypothetical protein